MKTTFVTSIICAIGSLIVLLTLSAITVLPDDSALHARWMAFVFALLVGSSLLAAWARSRLVKATIIIALLIASVPAIRAADVFENYIHQLAARTPEQDAIRAMHALEDAGVKAFPALLAHLDDGTPALASLYSRDESVTGTLPIGSFCFDILQTKIEDNWPKGFREFYILTPANVKQWIEAHKALSLQQLQLASREESLRRAEAELAARSTDLTTKAVEFLREEVAKLKQ